jgi:hypothetical protein
MYASRLRLAALATVAAAGLAACATPFGYGGVSVGNGYYGSNYGYGADYGYGYGGGYPGYGYGYNAGYPGYGYAGYPGYALGFAPYWGWYGDYYYPGTGYYVYDRDRHPHRWTDEQQRYWNALRQQAISSKEFRERMQQYANQQNWSGFDQGPAAAQRIQTSSSRPVRTDRSIRQERVQPIRPEQVERTVRPEQVGRSTVRSERADRSVFREQRRSEARSTRASESRADGSTDRRRTRISRND